MTKSMFSAFFLGSLAIIVTQLLSCGSLKPAIPEPSPVLSDSVAQIPIRPSDSMRIPEFITPQDSIPLQQRFSDALHALSDTLSKYWDGSDPASIPEEKRWAILQLIERHGFALAQLADALKTETDTVDTATITEIPYEGPCNPSTIGMQSSSENYGKLLECADSLNANKQWHDLLAFYKTLLKQQLTPTALVRAQFKMASAAYLLDKKNLAGKLWNRQWQQLGAIKKMLMNSEDYLKLYDLITVSTNRKEKILLNDFFLSVLSRDTLSKIEHSSNLVLNSSIDIEAKTLVSRILAEMSGTSIQQIQTKVEKLKSKFRFDSDTLALQSDLESLLQQHSELQLSKDSLFFLIVHGHFEMASQTSSNSPSKFAEDDLKSAQKLISSGNYIKVLPILDRLKNGSYSKDAGELRNQASKRFCKEKRTEAADRYSQYRREKDRTAQILLLQKAVASLDSCLTYFPNATISKRVLKNKNMILDKLQSLSGE